MLPGGAVEQGAALDGKETGSWLFGLLISMAVLSFSVACSTAFSHRHWRDIAHSVPAAAALPLATGPKTLKWLIAFVLLFFAIIIALLPRSKRGECHYEFSCIKTNGRMAQCSCRCISNTHKRKTDMLAILCQEENTNTRRWTVVDHATALCILTGEQFDSGDSVLTQVCLVFLCYQKAAEHPLPNMPWFECTLGLAWASQPPPNLDLTPRPDMKTVW